jgi:hypothetical protein
MKNDLRKDIPVEMEEAILGDETAEIGGDPLDLETIMEQATGISFNSYSQQKMVMSNGAVGRSERGLMFDDIFGPDAAPQSDFLKGMDSPNDLLSETQLPPHRNASLYERVIEAAQSLAETNPQSRKFLEAFVQKMKNSLSTKFLLEQLEAGNPFAKLTDAEFDELSRLRVIDAERLNCAFPSSL